MQGDKQHEARKRKTGRVETANTTENSPPNKFWISEKFQVIKNSPQVIKRKITWKGRKIIPQEFRQVIMQVIITWNPEK